MKIKSSNSSQITEYFHIFIEADEDWAKAEIEIEARESKKEKSKWMDGWFTRAQLLAKHNDDEEFVDGIIRQKLNNPKLWMPHPDNPESEAHRLYKALDFISEGTEQDKEATKTIVMNSTLEQAAVMPMLSTWSVPDVGCAGPSSSSSATLAITDVDKSDAATAVPGIPEELLQLQKAQQAKAEKLAKRKAEQEALKALPTTQAKKWEKQMGKQINDCTGYIAELQSSKQYPEDVKKQYVKEFRAELKGMSAMREQLQAATAESAVQLVVDAPVLEVQFKDLVKKWKKVAKALAP